MTLLIHTESYYAYKRTLECLMMMKRYHSAGFNVKEDTKKFTLHAANHYGWSHDGEPIDLAFMMLENIFNTTVFYEYDNDVLEDKKQIMRSMVIPNNELELTEDQISAHRIAHITLEDFLDIDFEFRKTKNAVMRIVLK